MSKVPQALKHMLAAWNEREPDKIRSHLDKALAPSVRFVDPSIDLEGVDAFEANVRRFRASYPDAVCSRATGVDSHHDLHRYEWRIHRGAELMLAGFDVVETDPQGRVLRVEGFFGPFPAKE